MSAVMISYARADARDFAERLAAGLRPHHRVWLDTGDIEGGAEWLRRIQKAIAGCDVFLAVRSPAGSTSSWVQRERLFAIYSRKPIVPVVARPCPSDDLELVIYQHVDFRGDFEPALRELLACVARRAGGATPPSDRRTLEQGYAGRVLLEYSVWCELYTPMAGVGQLLADPARAKSRMVTLPTSIDPVFRQFVQERLAGGAKNTRVQSREYADLLPAVEEMRQLVILGDPGSGKTTTLWRLAADYARRSTTDSCHPLPVLANLGGLRPEEDLEQYLAAQLGELGPYYRQLHDERRLAVLLDGLNELPAGRRSEHAAQVRALVARCREANLVAVVTCRELDYAGDLDAGVPRRLTITPLDPLRVRQFVSAYIKEPEGAGDELFWQLAGEGARGYWRDFHQSGIDDRSFWLDDDPPGRAWRLPWGTWDSWVASRDHPRSMLVLARNPYMLYMMTQVFTLEARLPSNRGLLFNWFIDFLLLKREKVSEAVVSELKGRLAELAYAIQAAGEGTILGRDEVLTHLRVAESLHLAQSANILSTGHDVRFSHQLLQEFFAAHKLDRVLRAGMPATTFWPADRWWEPRGWEETAVLLAGLYNDDLTPVLEWLGDANPEVAARCVAESGAYTPEKALRDLRSVWLARLTGPLEESLPEARAAVGRALGLLDLDDRPGVGLSPEGLPDIAWCEVPVGPFRMGGDPRVECDPWDGAVVDIGYAYWIAKYPVTYAQFTPFVEGDGYKDREYWTEVGWRWKGERTRPSHWNYPKWHIGNHPVVGITWYEAYAYARWLNSLVSRSPELLPPSLRSLPAGYPPALIRLPTEAEWEKAARYPDGRLYPWGNEYVAGRANVNEIDTDPSSRVTRTSGGISLKRTTAVGLYARGASPVGAFDLCGNVFDWCLSVYSEEYRYPEVNDAEGEAQRMTRGGAWLRSMDAARAAYREPVPPHTVYDDQGFRLCASAHLRTRKPGE